MTEETVNQYISNINNEVYVEYLDNYKKMIDDKKKCLKGKKCLYNFSQTIDKFSKDKISSNDSFTLKLPKYINTDDRLLDINERMKEISIEINLLQNTLNSESDKKDIDNYKTIRKEYMELEKEKEEINLYLVKVNNVEELLKNKIEIKNEIKKIELQRRNIYNEIQYLNSIKNGKKFDNVLYKEKITSYLDTKELDKLNDKLRNLDEFKLKSDNLFFSNVNRSEFAGRINYIINKLPEIQQTKKTKRIKKSLKSVKPNKSDKENKSIKPNKSVKENKSIKIKK